MNEIPDLYIDVSKSSRKASDVFKIKDQYLKFTPNHHLIKHNALERKKSLNVSSINQNS